MATIRYVHTPDEIAQVPGGVGGTGQGGIITLLRLRSRSAVYPVDEEFVAAPPAFPGEDEVPYAPTVTAAKWVPAFYSDEDVQASPPPPPTLEDEAPYVPTKTGVTWTPTAYSDDEVRVTPPVFEDESPYAPASVTVIWTPTYYSDDESVAVAPTAHWEDEWAVGVFVWPYPQPQLPQMEDETWVRAILDEEWWYGAAVTAITWTSTPFRDDEVYFSVTVPVLEEEVTPAATLWDRVRITPPNSDDEVLSIPVVFYLDYHEPWVSAVQVIPWVVGVFSDDEARGIPTTLFLSHDEFWTAQSESIIWTARPFGDDEIGAGLKNFYLTHDEPWVPQFELITWTAAPFRDDEVYFTTIVPILEEERTPPLVPWALPQPLPPNSDDEVGAGLKNFYLEEESGRWGIIVTPPVYTPVPVTDDEVRVTSAAAPVVDDEVRPPEGVRQSVIVYVPTSVGESWVASPIVDDDPPPIQYGMAVRGWTVQIVSWLAQSFTDDEILNFTTQPPSNPAGPGYGSVVTIAGRRPRPLGAWADDEVWVAPPVAFGIDDESVLPQGLCVTSYTARVFSDDEIGAGLKNFYLTHDEPWVAQFELTVWTATPFRDDEVYFSVTVPVLEDDRAPVMMPWTLPKPLPPNSDDEAGAGLKNFYLTHDEPWLTAKVTITWTPVEVRGDEFRVPPPTPVVVEDEACNTPVQPPKVIYATAAIYGDDGSALHVTIDQDDWLASTLPRGRLGWIYQTALLVDGTEGYVFVPSGGCPWVYFTLISKMPNV